MWTLLKNGVAIVPKAYTIRVDNVIILENHKLRFILPLNKLEGDVFGNDDKFGHPLYDFVTYLSKRSQKDYPSTKIYMVINGKRVEDSVCCLCKNRFKGLTGTCNIIKQDDKNDPNCHFEHLTPPAPPILQVKGGVYLPPRYFNHNYEPYYRDKSLEDYNFHFDIIDALLSAQERS